MALRQIHAPILWRRLPGGIKESQTLDMLNEKQNLYTTLSAGLDHQNVLYDNCMIINTGFI